MSDDPFDPRTWDWLDQEQEFHIYAGRLTQHECLVDEEDYLWFSQWLWSPVFSKGKVYFKRSVATYDIVGHRIWHGTLYLHREIMKRATGGPPTRRRNIVDHLDGDTLNSRKRNMRWATKTQNNRNRYGSAAKQQSFIELLTGRKEDAV